MEYATLPLAGTLSVCPVCQLKFAPQRKNQRYCARRCQRNATQGKRDVANSPTERRRSHEHYSRALGLADCLYTLPPNKRLGFMADIIDAARRDDTPLRNVLTDPVFLSANKSQCGLFHRRCPDSYKTLAQAADAYCRMFWGYGVGDVVHSRCPEPETGEIT